MVTGKHFCAVVLFRQGGREAAANKTRRRGMMFGPAVAVHGIVLQSMRVTRGRHKRGQEGVGGTEGEAPSIVKSS